MKKLGKKIISLMIVLCIAVSMMVMAIPSAQAVPGANFIKKKAIDLGLRFACAAATQLAAQCENDDLSIVVDSVIRFIISDAHGAATSDIKKMCDEILKELAVIEEDIREYTSEIASALNRFEDENMRDGFAKRWEYDVDNVVEKYALKNILDTYTRYLVVSTLYTNDDIPDVTRDAVEKYWGTISEDPLSYTYADCQHYETEFLDALKLHMTANINDPMSVAYDNAQIFVDIQNAINELTENFVYDSVSSHSEQYSVMDYAATEAYYALPFSSQQYEYTVAQGKRQVMVATVLEMALNEFLSLQGEYLVENNLQDTPLEYVYNSYNRSMTYNDCKSNYMALTDTVLEETCNLFASNVKVNCKPYTGEPSYECSLDDYMKPEDAVGVNLNVNGYESSHYYSEEKYGTEMWHMYAFSNMTSRAASIKNPTRFIRVMSGGKSREVYYILDASQYSEGSYMDFTRLKHDVKREYVTDGGVGDIHIVSCDYYNIIKQMTDGVNTYRMPSKDNITSELKNLISVPAYDGQSGYTLDKFLAAFDPANVWGTDECSENLRILTSTYNNHLKKGAPTAVKRGEITVVNADSAGPATKEILTESFEIHEDLKSKDYSFLAILSADSDTAFSQKASLKLDDKYDAFDKYYCSLSNDQQFILAGSDPEVFESGEKITVSFTVDDPNKFDSLKMVRKNVSDSETVLISGAEELSYYLNDDGTYSFDVTMPYSQVEFVLTSHESISPTVSFNKVDPAGTVSNVTLIVNDDVLDEGEAVEAYPGTELVLKFDIDNISSFKGFGTYNPETGEINVLINKDSIASHLSYGTCRYTYTMPENDVEFYVVTEEPDNFVPEELETDEEGNFLIGSYEELRSAAYFMNTFEEKYLTGNYKVTADINCMNAALEQFVAYDPHAANKFSGTFDGQGHTISNINLHVATDHAGLFSMVSGGEIRNLNLAGSFTVTNAGSESKVKLGTLANIFSDDCTVSNVNTDLTYNVSGFNTVSGIYGISSGYYGGTIENCFIKTNVDMPDKTISYGGACIGSGSYHSMSIRNSAFVADLDVADDSQIYGVLFTNGAADVSIEDSYAYVKLTGGDLAPITTDFTNSTYKITNTYFREEMLTEATSILYNTPAEPKTEEQFASGEVAYLLNKGITDGTEVWHQNLDNGKAEDAYPVFEGGTVYRSAGTCISAGEGYTNIQGEISHNYNSYHVCKDCITLREGEAAGIYGFSIGLGGNISVMYYTVLDEDVAQDESAKMVFTVPSGSNPYKLEIPVKDAQTTTVTVPALGETRTLYIFECEVAAKEMASDISCQVVSDSRESDTFHYTVKDYAEVILANPDVYSKEIPLVKAMLNYGAEAQIAFGYNLSNLANTSDYITEEEKVLADVDFAPYAHTIEDNDEYISYYGSALSLKSETAIKHYFYFENEEDVQNTVVTINGKPASLKKNGGYYELKVSDIPAHKLHDNYEVKVGDITLNYSTFSYCFTVSDAATDNGFSNVAKALYAYNRAALEYHNN